VGNSLVFDYSNPYDQELRRGYSTGSLKSRCDGLTFSKPQLVTAASCLKCVTWRKTYGRIHLWTHSQFNSPDPAHSAATNGSQREDLGDHCRIADDRTFLSGLWNEDRDWKIELRKLRC
jgi:hypothetical protein